MRKGIVEASKVHVAETHKISRSLIEKAMFMRGASYYSNAKATLLTQTIFEVDESRKTAIRLNESLQNSRKVIRQQNRSLERQVDERTRDLVRANHALSMLSRCNQLQIRAANEFELLDETCKLITAEGPYCLAWINYANPDSSDNPCPIAWAEDSGKKIKKPDKVCRLPNLSQCPSMASIQNRKTLIFRKDDTEFRSCATRAKAATARSLICLPLQSTRKIYGSLNICSSKVDDFAEADISLLQDLADDLSFGIRTFRLQEDRDQAHQKIQESLLEKESMLREIHHRVRNNLQLVVSLLHMQARKMQSKKFQDMTLDCEHRIMALAAIHEELYSSDNLSSIDCQAYFSRISDQLMLAFQPDNTAIHINANEIRLAINEAIPCGQILHELISNAIKYAFPDNSKGSIHVTFVPTAAGLELSIADNGIGIPAGFDIQSCGQIGMDLVRILAKQLDASTEMNVNGGTRWTIRLPHTKGA
ncbi:MAG: histidine kinase dimerization/phosphoacceptor domain -containing protein [Mariprofundaceae bacterium]